MIWFAIAALTLWNLWLYKLDADRREELRLAQRDIDSLDRAVHRLEHPVKHAPADHLAKKPLTAKKPRRRTPPSR